MQSIFPNKTLKDITLIILSVLLITFIMWAPHFFRLNLLGLDFSQGFDTIYRNFDGTEYIVIAKTFYNPGLIAGIPQSLPANYFAAHFPGYALAILLFAPLLGFLKSMLFVSLLFTTASCIAFYFLIKDFKLSNHPLWMSILFLILPARWLIVHSVGSAEPMFIFFVITSIYFFMKFEEKQFMADILLASIFGFLAQITRPPGALLFLSYGLYIIWKITRQEGNLFTSFAQAFWKYLPLILMPIGLFAVFAWYGIAYQDFFAYFHSGDNIHLTLPPFSVFNKNQAWVGDIWLEDVVYIFLLGLVGGLLLWKQKLYTMAFFVLTYVAATSLVAHRDISRYILPIFPFVLISFEKILVSKEFKIALAILLFGIYLYSQNYILANTAPIVDVNVFN